MEDILVRLDKDYDFSQLYHFNNSSPLNIKSIEVKYVEIMNLVTTIN